jgi:glycosyltransferase involved in cell wall biosynthesis
MNSALDQNQNHRIQAAASPNPNAIEISVVIPAYNEAPSLEELVARIDETMRRGFGSPKNHEIIVVDDGSSDDTQDQLFKLTNRFPCLRGVVLIRNLGKSAALMTGFGQARGDVIVTIDADLQDRPEDIPALVSKLREGYGLVSGWRQPRCDTLFRRLGSRLYNAVVRRVSGLDIHDMNSGIKAINQDVIRTIRVYGDFHRYIPLLTDLAGHSISEVAVTNDPRRYGESKYAAFRYQGLFDLVTILFTHYYMHRPLHFFAKASAVFLIPSTFVLGVMIIRHLLALVGLGDETWLMFERPLLTLLVVMFIVGVNIFLTGLACDFFLHHQSGRGIDESMRRNIKKEIHIDSPTDDGASPPPRSPQL